MGIGVLVSTLLVGGGLISCLAPALAIFLRLKQLSLVLALVAAFGALFGLMPAGALSLASDLATGYLLSLVLAKQLLAPCSMRQPAREWRAWCDEHQWALVGFGAPVVAAFHFLRPHPLVQLAILEATHISAARRSRMLFVI